MGTAPSASTKTMKRSSSAPGTSTSTSSTAPANADRVSDGPHRRVDTATPPAPPLPPPKSLPPIQNPGAKPSDKQRVKGAGGSKSDFRLSKAALDRRKAYCQSLVPPLPALDNWVQDMPGAAARGAPALVRRQMRKQPSAPQFAPTHHKHFVAPGKDRLLWAHYYE